jgi:AcrR family transcriptional regulator
VVAAIRSAVEELVAGLGAERVTVALVAGRAGVAPSSIYRRWGDLGTLINEVAAFRLDPGRPLPGTGDFWPDLRQWATELAAHYGTPPNIALLRAGAALAEAAPSDCTAARRVEAERLAATAPPGNPAPTAEQLVNHICAPIAYRAVFGPAPLTPAEVQTLIDDLRAIVTAPVSARIRR